MESGLTAYNHGKQLIKECASHRKALLTDGSGWAQKILDFKPLKELGNRPRLVVIFALCSAATCWSSMGRRTELHKQCVLGPCRLRPAVTTAPPAVLRKKFVLDRWLGSDLTGYNSLTDWLQRKLPRLGCVCKQLTWLCQGLCSVGCQSQQASQDSDCKLFMEQFWKWCMETLNNFRRRPIIFPPKIWRIRIYIYMYMYKEYHISDKRPNTKQHFSGGDENISL